MSRLAAVRRRPLEIQAILLSTSVSLYLSGHFRRCPVGVAADAANRDAQGLAAPRRRCDQPGEDLQDQNPAETIAPDPNREPRICEHSRSPRAPKRVIDCAMA